MKNPLVQLYELGQSPWYDNIERRLLVNGEMKDLILRGDIRGVTSNPSIFNNAIAHSQDYDEALLALSRKGMSTYEIYEQLVVEDIKAAADLFRTLYEQSNKGDGYVSLEVSPKLAHDTDRTLQEAIRLWDLVGRPNLMIKIPATKEGLPAIRSAIASGINVNVTLIFSLRRYEEVMNAFILGLEDRVNAGQSIVSIASVASFFVSRLDTKVDGMLDTIYREQPSLAKQTASLYGKLAVANARLAYRRFQEKFSQDRWRKVSNHGGLVQRPLWASTSTKNPKYPDTYYVDSLIGPDTVNTIPPKTLAAFKDHGTVAKTVDQDFELANQVFDKLQNLGISMDQVTQELEDEGVKAFADAFSSLIEAIELRRLAVGN